MNDWIIAKVIKIKIWSSNLFSIFLKANIEPFIAGQFAKIAIIKNNKKIIRAYSYINTFKNKNLEFYIKVIPNGIMSNTLLNLKKNDEIMINKKSFGYLTINNIPKSENLWMISTGTGIGPYLSILSKKKNLEKFKKIILINCIRYYKDLSYLNLIKKYKKKYKKKIIVKIILSREKKKKYLHGRITKLFYNKTIEKETNTIIKKKNSQIILCGNPNMIKELCTFFKNNKNMEKNLKNKLGSITIEKYW